MEKNKYGYTITHTIPDLTEEELQKRKQDILMKLYYLFYGDSLQQKKDKNATI